jgi:hypothetical protein
VKLDFAENGKQTRVHGTSDSVVNSHSHKLHFENGRSGPIRRRPEQQFLTVNRKTYFFSDVHLAVKCFDWHKQAYAFIGKMLNFDGDFWVRKLVTMHRTAKYKNAETIKFLNYQSFLQV